MRKWIALVAAMLLLCSFTCSAMAAENTLTLTDVQGQTGETVYMAVVLNESVTGNTVGITYTYDAESLQPMADASSWNIKGVLKDFDGANSGVWASSSSQSLSGTVCVLAFQIRKAVAEGSAVTCTLTVKDGATLVGTYTAEATVSTVCSHSYSDWQNQDALGHTRSCSLCGGSQTQSHNWDNGVVTENPNNPSTQLKTFTCSDCAATKATEIQKEQDNSIPIATAPQGTQPTEPVQSATRPTTPDKGHQSILPTTPDPNHQQLQSTEPNSGSNPQNGQSSGNAVTNSDDSLQSSQDFHVHEDGTVHYGDHVEDTLLTEEDLHNHETQATSRQRNMNMLLSAVIVGLMFGAGTWYLKKKKH